MKLLIIFLVIGSVSCSPQKITTFYDDDKTLKMEEYYVKGPLKTKSGAYLTYGLNGDLETKANFKNGKIHGEEFSFCSGTSQPEMIFKYNLGKLDGISRALYCNGKPRYSLKYEDDRLLSVFELFSISGEELYAGNHTNGTGELLKYDKNGTVIERIRMKDGVKHGFRVMISNTGYVDSIKYVNGFVDDPELSQGIDLPAILY